MRRLLTNTLAAIGIAVALSGCIYGPWHHGGYHDGGGYHGGYHGDGGGGYHGGGPGPNHGGF